MRPEQCLSSHRIGDEGPATTPTVHVWPRVTSFWSVNTIYYLSYLYPGALSACWTMLLRPILEMGMVGSIPVFQARESSEGGASGVTE